MNIIAGKGVTIRSSTIDYHTGIISHGNIDLEAEEIILGGYVHADNMLRIVTDKLTLVGAEIVKPKLYDIQAKKVVIEKPLKNSRWLQKLIQKNKGSSFIKQMNFNPFDPQAEDQIRQILTSPTFLTQKLSYKYYDNNYDLHLVVNPEKKPFLVLDQLMQPSLIVASYSTLPTDLQEHLKEIIGANINTQEVVFEFESQRNAMPSDYQSIQINRVFSVDNDQEIHDALVEILSSDTLKNETIGLIDQKNVYCMRIIHNPNNAPLAAQVYVQDTITSPPFNQPIQVVQTLHTPLALITKQKFSDEKLKLIMANIATILGDETPVEIYDHVKVTQVVGRNFQNLEVQIPFYDFATNLKVDEESISSNSQFSGDISPTSPRDFLFTENQNVSDDDNTTSSEAEDGYLQQLWHRFVG